MIFLELIQNKHFPSILKKELKSFFDFRKAMTVEYLNRKGENSVLSNGYITQITRATIEVHTLSERVKMDAAKSILPENRFEKFEDNLYFLVSVLKPCLNREVPV